MIPDRFHLGFISRVLIISPTQILIVLCVSRLVLSDFKFATYLDLSVLYRLSLEYVIRLILI